MSTILIAEDDLLIAEMIGSVLIHAGHEVFHAADGGGALEAIRAEEIDLVLLDLMLPVTSGLEILRKLKSDPLHAGIPVVVVSARSRPKDLEAARDAGAADYLTKPFSLTDLLNRVRRALAGSA
jgi:two-component system phosphate regulon response regulator PhoB